MRAIKYTSCRNRDRAPCWLCPEDCRHVRRAVERHRGLHRQCRREQARPKVKVLLVNGSPLIVGTPVYYGQPNGGILSLMQRLFFSAGHLVQNKPAAALAVCRRGGATATLQTMNMMFEMMNMPLVTSQYWNIAYGAGKGEVKLDTEGMQTMRTLVTNMAFLLQKIHADGHPAPQRDERPAFMNFIR